MTKDIYAPGLGDEVQIGQQTNSFSVSLSDELLASVRMSRVRAPSSRPSSAN
jgi:cleavage and polyadenylation specificity factor subunit 2